METKIKWIEDLKREINLKKAIVISGNTEDVYLDTTQNIYVPILTLLGNLLKSNGFKTILEWDQFLGLQGNKNEISLLAEETVKNNDTTNNNDSDYDMGIYELDDTNTEDNKYINPNEFFSILYTGLKQNNSKVFIVDLTNYLFNAANTLSDDQKKWATIIHKAIRDSNISNSNDKQNIVIFLVKGNTSSISSILASNPASKNINIPLPERKDREAYIEKNIDKFSFDKEFTNEIEKANFIDLLDGLLIKEIQQIQKLSSINTEKISANKLINIYKYGISTSPWEELSKNKIKDINKILSKRVKGQNDAIEKLEKVVKRAYTGLSGLQHSTSQKKPKGALFFVGPTGVGKTELAKSLAEFLFGDEEACLRFDMSEYNHEHSDQRLVGAPPGYVGYEKGGQLTNAVKNKPFSILLFDEIEKANGKILDKFLQILEDGRLTDGKGETVSFANTIIIFTSNIGAADTPNGYSSKTEMPEIELHKYFSNKVKNHFSNELGRPELLNRIGDNIVVFNYITEPRVMNKIIKAKLVPAFESIKEKYKVTINFDDEDKALSALSAKANPEHGGRGVLNVIETMLIDGLSEFIFDNKDLFYSGKSINIIQKGTKAIFDFELV